MVSKNFFKNSPSILTSTKFNQDWQKEWSENISSFKLKITKWLSAISQSQPCFFSSLSQRPFLRPFFKTKYFVRSFLIKFEYKEFSVLNWVYSNLIVNKISNINLKMCMLCLASELTILKQQLKNQMALILALIISIN